MKGDIDDVTNYEMAQRDTESMQCRKQTTIPHEK